MSNHFKNDGPSQSSPKSIWRMLAKGLSGDQPPRTNGPSDGIAGFMERLHNYVRYVMLAQRRPRHRRQTGHFQAAAGEIWARVCPSVEVLEDRTLLMAVIGNNIGVGDQLRNYRLAIAATAEYTAFFGGQTQALAAIQTFVENVNQIFERELAIHFDLVSTTNTIFTDTATDGYSNGSTNLMINENTPILNAIIGSDNYDIGHVFGTTSSGGSGLAGLGVVNTAAKGRGASVSSDPQGLSWVLLVAHEFGHQFNAEHTFNANAFGSTVGNRSASSAYEPASGSTIMSYAGIASDGAGNDNLQDSPDDYFHAASFEAIQTFIATTGTPHSITATGNSRPTIAGGADYVIPTGTAFALTAAGSDADPGDTLTYTWEQLDLGPAMSLPLSDNGSSPLFRSFAPSAEGTRVFPNLDDLINNVNTAATGEVLPTTNRSLNFRATVRDGNSGVNSDDVLITVVNTGSAFAVLSPNTAVNWTGGSMETITWNVAGTNANGINVANVAIELSLDGGRTFAHTLAASTANDGSFTFSVPNINTSQARIRVRALGNVFFDISNANFSITANTAAPGFLITESAGVTRVSEDGVVGGSLTDTYTIAPNTIPAGPVTVTITADAQTEVSLDGINFFSSLQVTFTDKTARTITVRGLDDSLQEGIHSGGILHTVTSSSDPSYPVGMLINPVSASIADDELQPVVGVDFDQLSGSSPTNWTRVSQTFGGTTNNLIREDGLTTGIGLTVAVSGAAGLNQSTPSAVPKHSPSLEGIDGNHLATESMTLTWTGLTPGKDYNIYLLASEFFSTNAVQSVTITGGAGNPLSFIQDTRGIGNGLLVNAGLANPSKTLEADAVIAQADSSGRIQIVVDNVSPNSSDDVILSGAAIQEVGPGTVGFSVVDTGGSTSVTEAGSMDTFSVVLKSQPTGNVVINVSSNDTGEATVGPTTLTFTTSNWNIAQTVTVTGVDDALTDGSQTSIVTLTIDDALTQDDAYDSVGDRLVTVVTQDNEAIALVGVDFDATGAPPTNWTSIRDIFGSTTLNLIREDGSSSPIDLSIAVAGGANVQDTPAPTNLPDHTPSLAGLGGVRFAETSITLTWAGLSPGTSYDLFLFVSEPFLENAVQTVTITGEGMSRTPFIMDTRSIGSQLLVNSAIASPSRTLSDDAVRASADSSGRIQLSVVNTGGDFVFLSGAAIQEVVAAPNNPPMALASSVTTDEDTAKTFAVGDFKFSDMEGDSLGSITISALNLAGGDTLKLNGVNVTVNQTIAAAQISSLLYTPAANANGNARSTFDFKVNDEGLGTVAATMTINVTAVNDVPIALASSVTTNEDTAKTFAVGDFNFSDVEGDGLASITISALNLASGDALKLNGVDVTVNQTITADQISNLIYTPAANANGNARSTFDFRVNDAQNGTAAATMTINVTAVNDVPVALASSVTTDEDTAKTFGVADFNFTDVDGDSLASITISALNLASGDTLKLNGVNVNAGETITAAQISNLVYTPVANANGNARSTFDFKVNDGGNGTVIATMTINVTAVNDVPVALASSVTTSEDTARAFAVTDFNFTDVEGDSLASITISALNLASGDTLKFNGMDVTVNQTIAAAQISGLVYTPAANANGNARSAFDFKVNDGGSGAVAANMTINVTAVNDVPIALASSVTADEDTAKTFAVTDFNFSDVEGDSLASITISALNLASGDTLKLDGADVTVNQTITAAQISTLIYTAAANANGNARSTFDFRVNDSQNGTVAATLTINVTAVNDLPIALASSVTTDEDTAKTFAVGDFNFMDVDGDGLASITISALNLAGGDTLKLDGADVTVNQTITAAQISRLVYAPAANANGNARSAFDFKANDGGNGTVAATLTINVTAVNDLPIALASSVTTDEDTAKTFAVADFNFSDVEGDSLASITVSALNLASGDTLKLDGADVTVNQTITAAQISTLIYTAAANANGNARSAFDFKVNDGGSGSVAATMTINVTAVNDVPVALASNVTTSEDMPRAFAAADFNFSDVEGDSLASITISALNLASGDTLKLNGVDVTVNQTIAAGEIANLVYAPAANANGNARSSFDFRANDSQNGTVAATMTINVTAVNDVPVALASSVTTNEDTARTFAVGDFNFTDVEGDSLASITISALNLASGDTLKLNGVDVTANQTITVGEIANLVYAPAPNANGNTRSTFDFKVNDGGSGTVAATMTIDVTAVNDVPVALASSVTTSEDTARAFAIADFNFTDVEGDGLASITITALNLANGDLLKLSGADVTVNQTITAAEISSLIYTPATDALGNARSTFDFRVNDSQNGTVAATMTINVSAANDPPIALASSVTTNEDSARAFAVTDFRFSDLEGDSLASITISALNLASGDTLKLSGMDVTVGQTIASAQISSLVYAPAANANGNARSTFDFKVNDGGSGTVAATMTINVNAVNDVPVALTSNVTTSEDTPRAFAAADFNFTDVEGDGLASITISALNLASGDSLKLNGVDVTVNQTIAAGEIGNLVYAAAADANGVGRSTFDFRVNDTQNGTVAATMTIDVTAVNDLPIALASSVTTNEDTTRAFAAADFNFTDVEGDSLASITISALNLASGDSLKLNGVDVIVNQTITVGEIANLVYLPAPNANGNGRSTFDFKINDGGSGSAAATMTINVTAVNDVPVALASSVTTNEDTTKTFAVGDFNFSDVEGDSLASITISGLNLASGDALKLNGVDVTVNQIITAGEISSLLYTPAANANGNARSTFDFKVNDGASGSVAATMTINVTAVNDVPVALASSVTTAEDTAKTFAVTDFNFSDVEGDSLASITISALNLAVGDALKLNGVEVTLNQIITAGEIPTLVYTPAGHANGNARSTFDFKVNDGGSGTVAATMTINVTAVNDLPIALASSVTTSEDTVRAFAATDFNFTDLEGDGLASITISALNLASGDSLKLSGMDVIVNQTITVGEIANLVYSPAPNANGNARSAFDFKVNDGGSGSVAATMTINVTAVNDVPVALPSSVTTNEDTAKSFAVGDFNFSDVEGDGLASITISALNLASGDALKLNGVDVTVNQTITAGEIANLVYAPAPNANGNARSTFDFKVNDGGSGTTAATMTINVTAINDVPVAIASSVTTDEDIAKTFAAGDFNFSDVEGDGLASITITALNLASGDSLKLSGMDVTVNQTINAGEIANLVYAPAPNANGNARSTFDFKVNDGGNGSVAATMTINVTAVNDVPVALASSVTTSEDTARAFGITDFNFTDVEGDSLASITITALNLASGDMLKLSGADVTLNQTITAEQISNLVYTPAADALGNPRSTFEFRVNDSQSGTVAATMTISVSADNDPPIALASSVTTSEDTARTFSVGDFNFSDLEGDGLVSITISALNLASGDSLKLSGVNVTVNQTITAGEISNLVYAPADNANGNARSTFDFKVNDGGSGTIAATMTINVSAVNDVPVALASTVTTDEDIAKTFTVGDFNFSDVEGDSLSSITITALNLASGDTLQLDGVDITINQTINAGDVSKLVYAPAANANGNARSSFDFRVNDTQNGTGAATMTMNVNAVNDVPVALASHVTTSEDTARAFVATDLNFSDVEGDNLASITITALNLASGDTLKLNGMDVTVNQTIAAAEINNLVYTPAANANGNARSSFDFKVNDGGSGTVSATMTINVTAVNDVPVALASSVATNEDTTKTFAVGDFNFTDVEGDSLASITISALNLASGDTLKVNGVDVTINQTITMGEIANLVYAPAPNANGNARSTFDFKVNDGGSGSVAATMTINVTAVNDVPVALASSVTTSEDTARAFGITDFNFTDVEGDSLASITISTLNLASGDALKLSGMDVTVNQTITVDQISNLVYTPAANANGNARSTFDFRVNDSQNGTVAATMTINVSAANDPPVALASSVTTNEDTARVFSITDFNFSDLEGDSFTSITISALNLANGDVLKLGEVDVTVNQTIAAAQIGNLVYTPALNANGNARSTFDFRVNDSQNGTIAASMTINVSAVNDVPIALAGSVTTSEDTAKTFAVEDFNFSDVEGDGLASITITALNLASGDSLKLSGMDVTVNQTITAADISNLVYTPAANANGNARSMFDFRVNDSQNGIVASTMTINVSAVNDVPVALASSVTTNEDTSRAFAVTDFRFSDVESDSLASITITALNLAAGDSLKLGGADVAVNQTITAGQISALVYTPAANANGNARSTFGFRVNDTQNGTVAATMTINVLDGVPVSAPVITAISDDTGKKTNDQKTSDRTLIFRGTADPFSVISFTHVGVGVVGTTTTDATGRWTFDYTGTTLRNGRHDFTATATDAAGNTSDPSPKLKVVVHGPGRMAAGPGPGHRGLVPVSNPISDEILFTLDPFPGFMGGIRVATGDVNGDGTPDIITGAGTGAGPHIKVFDGMSGEMIRSFFAFDPSFTGGVFVAAGDFDGDHHADIVAGADAGGGPHVRIFSGRLGTELFSFFAFAPNFRGGVRVAVGDVTSDGTPDLIAGAGPGARPLVQVFDGTTGEQVPGAIGSFSAYHPNFRGGVFVAAGFVNADDQVDIITGAGEGGGSHVIVFDGRPGTSDPEIIASFFAYHPDSTGGVRVSVSDINLDGYADIVTAAGLGGGPHVRVLSAENGIGPLVELDSRFVFETSFTGGVFVAGNSDLITPVNPQSLRLSEGFASDDAPRSLTLADALPVFNAALIRLESAGVSSARIHDLATLTLHIADLEEGVLAKATLGSIILDLDAAGVGWFIDPTPLTDEEFADLSFEAIAPNSIGRIDLLTAILHELGHQLGGEHVDVEIQPNHFLAETLPPGQRRLPRPEDFDVLFADAELLESVFN